MDLDAIRAAIVATLRAVPGIGMVHEYERYARAERDFRDLYQVDNQLLGWTVRRVATRSVREDWAVDTTVDWVIRGYMALEDSEASELVFDALLESVRAAFLADPKLGLTNLSTDTEDAAGLQLAESGPVMFAGVLCHAAKFTLRTVHYGSNAG